MCACLSLTSLRQGKACSSQKGGTDSRLGQISRPVLHLIHIAGIGDVTWQIVTAHQIFIYARSNARCAPLQVPHKGEGLIAGGTVQHMPPIVLDMTFPPDYPSAAPPLMRLSAPWLSAPNLLFLESHLEVSLPPRVTPGACPLLSPT